jgi:hypothetical protein
LRPRCGLLLSLRLRRRLRGRALRLCGWLGGGSLGLRRRLGRRPLRLRRLALRLGWLALRLRRALRLTALGLLALRTRARVTLLAGLGRGLRQMEGGLARRTGVRGPDRHRAEDNKSWNNGRGGEERFLRLDHSFCLFGLKSA